MLQDFLSGLQTSRIYLRQVDTDDASFIHELLNDPGFIKNIGDRKIDSINKAESYIGKAFTTPYEKYGYGMYAVVDKQLNVPVGICGMVNREGLYCPDLGFAFLQQFTRKGYGLESSQLILMEAQQRNISELKAITLNENTGSISLLKRLGFNNDGVYMAVDPVEELMQLHIFL